MIKKIQNYLYKLLQITIEYVFHRGSNCPTVPKVYPFLRVDAHNNFHFNTKLVVFSPLMTSLTCWYSLSRSNS